ncbi:hypothetical protein [Pseudochryseolinea flava]|uniref:Uncharacterized protein n=1 Tax=Pseudochryseolinea flava TaxID=2059302 RepID=A0A364Y4Y4_9BACT|nr:hypothetical protein [Pseudochryseolinea flava]RAW02058.1 hypothetical protein DQQ10_05765 [Pseudochryseolinea flava]
MFSFNDKLDHLSNSRLNLIQHEVKRYISSDDYKAYSSLVFPVDRAIEIHFNQYQRVIKSLATLNEQATHDDEGQLKLNSMLMAALTEIHGYLSSQLSMFDTLEHHARKHGLSNYFISDYDSFRNSSITQFFLIYKNNILNEFNFLPLLQFNSGKGYQKLVYRVDEWVQLEEWTRLQDFFLSLGEFVVIDKLLEEYYDNACDVLDRYQKNILNNNKHVVEKVLSTLLGFVTKYEALGQNGFLPVTRSYLEKKFRDIER